MQKLKNHANFEERSQRKNELEDAHQIFAQSAKARNPRKKIGTLLYRFEPTSSGIAPLNRYPVLA